MSTFSPAECAQGAALPLAEDVLAALRSALDAHDVLTGEDIPARHSHDWSGVAPVWPRALVRPRSTDEVAAVLRHCHAARVPVVPQGGLTGLAGGAIPSAEGVAMTLDKLCTIERLDATAGLMWVQAGATLQAVQEAAAQAGWRFGLDLGARGSCQIGGTIATNAGGNEVLRFGMMREQVLGLEVVLADGTVLDLMHPMRKNNAGYDLKQLFVGSEGTLAVVTRALLKLHPAGGTKATTLVALQDYDSAMALLRLLRAKLPDQLSAFELMWADFYEAALRWTGSAAPFAQPPALCALIDVDGAETLHVQVALEGCLEEAMGKGWVVDALLAQSETQVRNLWQLREATAELPAHMQAINFDISIPMQEMGAFAQRCVEALAERWPAHHTVRFGHLGDGNLHLSTDARALGDLPFAEAEHQVEELIYALVKAFRGSVSGEHGIGLHKRAYLHCTQGEAERATMRTLKHALDPLGILNPGKIFLPESTAA